MKPPHFPTRQHSNLPAIRNTHDVFRDQLSLGQRAADRLAQIIGSWNFIIAQSILLVIWAILNSVAWINHWDPYPFILMNLVLSTQAAVTGPIIMMSQNRQADRDRIESHNDYEVNIKAEQEIRLIMEHLEAQNQALIQIHQLIADIRSQDASSS